MTAIADPIQDWEYKDWAYKDRRVHDNNKTSDVYGGLFFHVRHILTQFCERLKTCEVAFRALNVDAETLDADEFAVFEDSHTLFDLIEISNIADTGYIGPPESD
jgi:hypothetical protein